MKTFYDYNKIDFSQDVTRETVDSLIYDGKFKFVDEVLAMKNPHPKYWRAIDEDASMKAYAFFRMNGGPLQLYPYQDLIINDKHRFKYFRAANQIGKSLYLDVDAIINFIKDHGHSFNSAIVSKSLPQSIHQMRRIKGLMNAMEYLDWHEDKGSSDSMSVISLDFKNEKGKVKYSNLIICAPCTEGLLGYDLHKLYLDEFEFWEVDIQHFFNQIAQPRTYTTKGDIIITTNPNGADNFGAELEQQMVRGKRKWHVYVFNFLDRPGNTQIEYDDLKEELDRASFESTVASVRTLSDRNYFSPDEIERSEDKNLKEIDMVGEQPIFFLDVGAKHDQSCLIGGFIELDEDYDEAKSLEDNKRFIHFHVPIIHLYPKGYPLSRVMGVDSPNQESDGWHHEKSVKDHLSEWTIEGVKPYFGYDITGNEGMKPLMDALKIDATDISFSGPSKSAMYQRYKFVMEKGLLHRIKHKEWDSQARTIVVSKSARGYLLINAASQVKKGGRSLDAALKKIPDDTQDATAGFFELADSIHYIPASMVMVGVDD